MIVEGASEARIVRPGHGDNSELRARLSGRTSDGSTVVAELRVAMLEREEAEHVPAGLGRKHKP